MRMRIEPLPGREDEITCALVFAPVTQTPAAPLLLIQRPDAQDGVLGRRGWAVASNGLRPRQVERRGDELWAMFGSELSWHVQRGTPIAVRERDGELAGRAIWPAIARGRQPAMPASEEEDSLPPPARPAPPPVAPPVTPSVVPPVAPPPTPIPPPEQARTGGGARWLLALLPLLLIGAGGGYWWMNRAEAPPPAPSPAPVATPTPPADPCLDLATILTACPRERLATLPPEVQTRLAEGLLGMEGRPALGLGLSLLITAANRHGPAQLALARLYDPAHFRPGGAVSAANPARALDLYRDAAAASIAGAAEARSTLVERLRREAVGEGEAAARARTVLRQAGIE
jgi:hypothetical protein